MEKWKNLTGIGLIVITLLVILPGLPLGVHASYPEKAIQYMVQASAGGSSDTFVRKIVSILERNKLCPVPIQVVYKSGGSGAVSYSFTAGKRGDPYYIQNSAANFITTPIQNPKCPDYKHFTPIVRLALDQNVIVVKADSPFMNMKDLVEQARKNPKKVNWGGTSVGAPDHLTMILIEKAEKVQFNYVAFTAGNEVMANLLGGHIAVATMNAFEAKPQVEAKNLRILGLASEKRANTLPDTKTLQEQGIPVVLYVQRGVVAPADIPREAQTFLVSMFQKLTQTKEWGEYLENEGLADGWLAGEAYGAWLGQEAGTMRNLLSELGMAK